MSKDLFNAPDYFHLDELYLEEHKLVRDAARDWVKREFLLLLKIAVKKLYFQSILLVV